jgi:ubiquinone/menaquinone biosynthesis C-methylase UbiE
MTNVAGERRYDEVYGDTFSLYSRKEMLEFIEPFQIRFEKNGLDPREAFGGKHCLDAACGNGRGALFMLMNGAASVTACDFSPKNVESTRAFLKQFGFTNAEVAEHTLEQLPYPDESFDIVWCNGVLMHTRHPNRCLREITRVLKVGGRSWIYVYGAGGVYWRTIRQFRKMLEGVPVTECIAALRLLRYETRYVAEFIDDWFATHLRSYTHTDFGKSLAAVGFAPAELLPYGTAYDTSQRRNSFGPDEKDLMGEGDLRYFLTKAHATPAAAPQILDEGEYGSAFDWPATITAPLDPALAALTAACERPWQRIAAAAHVQRELRLQMTRPEPFNLGEFMQTVDRIASYAASCGKL